MYCMCACVVCRSSVVCGDMCCVFCIIIILCVWVWALVCIHVCVWVVAKSTCVPNNVTIVMLVLSMLVPEYIKLANHHPGWKK